MSRIPIEHFRKTMIELETKFETEEELAKAYKTCFVIDPDLTCRILAERIFKMNKEKNSSNTE